MFYKDDLNWMKGIGCYVWDTPEIVRAKKAYELQSDVSNTSRELVMIKFRKKREKKHFHCLLFQLKYKDEAKKEFNNYSIVTDTPIYVTAVLGHTWASEVSELHTFNVNCPVIAST